MKINQKLKTTILLIIIFIMSIHINIYATDLELGEYSKRYEEWLNLDKETRANTIAPLPVNIRGTTSTISNLYQILKSTTIPSQYDLRDHINVEVKNQQNTGLCWGFSANSALETYLALNNKTYNFSERHLEYNTTNEYASGTNPEALNRKIGEGGYATTAFTYYSRGSGPVLEEDMPFQNSEEPISIEELPTNVAVQKVDDMIYFPSIYKKIENGTIIYEDASGVAYSTSEVTQIRNQIKEHIMNYGAITASVNADSVQLNKTTYAANLNKDNVYSNHAVTIIGWDDSYSKDNFLSAYKPTTDGAYIILNSWGEDWGNNGTYYIFYEDFLVETDMRGVTSVSDIEYDNLYQHDTSEMYGSVNVKYAANVFKSEQNEKLTEIMIGTWATQTCNIYINKSGNDLNVNNLTKIANNVTLEPGYNTIEITENVELTKGNNFAIVVELTGDYSGIGVEYNSVGFGNATIGAGESYYSFNGTTWGDLYNEDNIMNLCIKAYTQEDEKDIEIGDIRGKVIEGKSGTIGLPISTTYEAKGKNAQITILKNGEDITKNFKISGNTIRGNGAYVTIKYPSDVQDGEYTIKVTVPGVGTQTKNIIFIGEKYDIAKCTITGIEIKIYTGNTVTQSIKIKNEERTLIEGTDYDIKYTNNLYPGKATITITGKGIFKGTITKYFNIIPNQITGLTLDSKGYNDLTIKWTAKESVTGYQIYIYNTESNIFTTNSSYKISKLKEGTTYKFKVRSYKEIDGTNYYGEYSNILIVSTNVRTNISSCTISGIKNKEYTGDNITQSISVKNGNTTLRNGIDYTLSYSNNKNPGKAIITITGEGIYQGTITETFIITPKKISNFKAKDQTTDKITLNWTEVKGAKGYKIYSYNYSKKKWEYIGNTTSKSYTVKKLKARTTYKYKVRAYVTVDNKEYFGSYSSNIKTTTKTKTPSISKLTTKNKKATIEWKKVTGATGYEVYMATSKKGKYSKIKNITKSSTTNYTKSKLKKNKKYYFKIRTYRTVDGKKIYSSYSSVKSIKIK